jgi:hypothetical protein
MKIKIDADGYCHFYLNRERRDRRGKHETERRSNGVVKKRYRIRRFVSVHRLVKMKAIAIGVGGYEWRLYVKDLPRGVDVNHRDKNRQNNHHMNLALQTENANRSQRELSQEEADQIAACTF